MKIKLKEYTRADCSCCGTEQAVYANGITPCAVCGKPLFPCNACQVCLYEACPFDGKTDEELKAYMNKPIPKDIRVKVLRIFNRQSDARMLWWKFRRCVERLFEKRNEEDEWLPF